jgi:hypothetical protein
MRTNRTNKLRIVLAGVLALTFAFEAAALDARPEVQKSTERAVALYPDSGVAGTALSQAIDAECARLHQANPAFFNDADWPLMLTSKLAANLGIQPVAQPQGGQQPKAIPNQPPPRVGGGTLLDKKAAPVAYRMRSGNKKQEEFYLAAKAANPGGTQKEWEATGAANFRKWCEASAARSATTDAIDRLRQDIWSMRISR